MSEDMDALEKVKRDLLNDLFPVVVEYEGSTYRFPERSLHTVFEYRCDGEYQTVLLSTDCEQGLKVTDNLRAGDDFTFRALSLVRQLALSKEFTPILGWDFRRDQPGVELILKDKKPAEGFNFDGFGTSGSSEVDTLKDALNKKEE